jgi:hypothetical protein
MSKIEPLTPILSTYTGTAKLNAHLDKIEAAFQNTLSRDGSAPNEMEADINMNDNQLINVAEPLLDHNVATKRYVDDLVSGEGTYLINTGALGSGWPAILTGTSSYIPIYPTGVAATDTAAAVAALAEASSTRKPIEVMRNGNILRLNQGMSVGSNVRWIGNGVTHELQVGSGGFNSTTRNDKYNQNAQNTCLFMIGDGGGVAQREDVGFHDIVFSASSASERIIQLIVATEGFSTSQLRLTDMYMSNLKTGAALLEVNSLGDGSAWIENISARDCNVSGTTWTGGPQTSVIEVDSSVTPNGSKPGVIRGIRGKNLSMTGSALSTYGNQSDLVTLANVLLATKSGAWQVSDLYADGVGEVIDCMANGAQIMNVRGENIMFVLKFIHGARYCTATNISGRGISNALITFGGTSAAGSGDTLQNVVSNATCESFTGNDAPAVLFQENVGTVGLPKKNTVMGLRVLGDSNGDWYVKDNCSVDNDNDNRVYLMDGSAAGIRPINITYSDNTKVHSTNRGIAHINLGANQTLTSSLSTIDFSVAQYDPEGILVSASDKVTVKLPGLYLVTVGMRFSTDLDDQNVVDMRVVGGGITQVCRQIMGAGAKEPAVRATFHVRILEQDIGSATSDIYVQAAAEGPGDATLLATTNYTGMWITRIG